MAGLLAAVWFSFGQNVLSPREQLSVPQRLGELELVSIIEGSEAMAQITGLHGTDIELVSTYIAEYAGGSERGTVWVGATEGSQAGAELTNRMLQAIGEGSSGFSNLQQFSIAGYEVFRVDGPGGVHFFYNSREEVVWLAVEAADALAILKEVLDSF